MAGMMAFPGGPTASGRESCGFSICVPGSKGMWISPGMRKKAGSGICRFLWTASRYGLCMASVCGGRLQDHGKSGVEKTRPDGSHHPFRPLQSGGRIFRAWDQWSGAPDEDTAGWAIIDCMMNINLLYWASDETGDPRFREQAVMYADQVMKYYIRPDGSSNHIMKFDPVTGELTGLWAARDMRMAPAGPEARPGPCMDLRRAISIRRMNAI